MQVCDVANKIIAIIIIVKDIDVYHLFHFLNNCIQYSHIHYDEFFITTFCNSRLEVNGRGKWN